MPASLHQKRKHRPSWLLTYLWRAFVSYYSGSLKILMIIIILLFNLGSIRAQGYDDGYDQGKELGKNSNQASWIVRGAIGTSLFSVVGLAVTVIGAGSEKVSIPDSIIPTGNPDYRNGFIQGYKESIKSERAGNAWLGSGIGILVNSIVLYAILKSQHD